MNNGRCSSGQKVKRQETTENDRRNIQKGGENIILSLCIFLLSWTRKGREVSHFTTTLGCLSLTVSRWRSPRPGEWSGWPGTMVCSLRKTFSKLSRAQTSFSRVSTRTMTEKWRRWGGCLLTDWWCPSYPRLTSWPGQSWLLVLWTGTRRATSLLRLMFQCYTC